MEIELLTADGCSLCDQARAMVEQVAPGVTLIPVDIAADEALIRQWGERIPVLRHGERTLEWPFTLLDVETFMEEVM
jgi:hypothetical protein